MSFFFTHLCMACSWSRVQTGRCSRKSKDRVTSLGLSKCPCHSASPPVSLLPRVPVTSSYSTPMALSHLPPSVPGSQLPGLSSCLFPFSFLGGTLGSRRAWARLVGVSYQWVKWQGRGGLVAQDGGQSRGRGNMSVAHALLSSPCTSGSPEDGHVPSCSSIFRALSLVPGETQM